MKLRDPVSRSQDQLIGELDGEVASKADHHLVCLYCAAWGIAQQGQGGRGEESFTRVRLQFVRLDVPIKGNDDLIKILCKSGFCGGRGRGGEGGLLHRQSGIAHLGVGGFSELDSHYSLSYRSRRCDKDKSKLEDTSTHWVKSAAVDNTLKVGANPHHLGVSHQTPFKGGRFPGKKLS